MSSIMNTSNNGRKSILATKINVLVILGIAATGLLVLGVATTTVFAQQNSSTTFTAKLSGSNEVPSYCA